MSIKHMKVEIIWLPREIKSTEFCANINNDVSGLKSILTISLTFMARGTLQF